MTGSQLLPFVKNLCQSYEELQTQVDSLHGVQSGTIRIGTISSIATHWLPNIIRAFQKDYPGIDYELLLGDYTEIGGVDQGGPGRLRLCAPADLPTFEIIPLEQDRLLATLPVDHPLAKLEKVPIAALCQEPFMLLEKGAKAEISEVFERNG